MTDDLASSFEQEKFANDEPVHVFRPDQYGLNVGGVWMPERIWHRLRLIGAAYELHLLPLLDGSTDPVFLNPSQVDQLVREMKFVGQLVDDPLLESQIRSLLSVAAERSEGASKDSLGIEFP